MLSTFVSGLTPPEQYERTLLQQTLQSLLAEDNLEAVQEAQCRLQQWLLKHPNDRALWNTGEVLAKSAEAIRATTSSLTSIK